MSSSSLLVEPAYATIPEYRQTLGPEVADLARLADFGPDPEQEFALDALFALDAHGQAAVFEFAVVCCRQNLKTGLFKQAALGWLFITDQRLVVWSAHEFRTSQEAFRDMTHLIEGCPELDRRVKQVHRGNGEEAIELLGGQRLIFKARTKGGGRGLSGDKVVLDEAFALQPFHMGALLPTLAARPDPQVVYGSSAGLAESAVLRDIRDRGRPGGSPRMAYLEWGVERGGCSVEDCAHEVTAQGCALDDEERWGRANPALGRRIDVETLRSLRQSMPPVEFAREQLGWWDEPATSELAFDLSQWESLGDTGAKLAEPARVTLAVAVSNDRRWGSIGVVGAASGGRELLMVRSGRGTRWLVEEAVRLKAKHEPLEVALDPAGQAGALLPDLEVAGLAVTLMTAREMGQACGAFLNGVDEGRFVHLRQGELDAALSAARTRDVGDAQRWDSRGDVDISPLVAVTIAAHCYAKSVTVEYDLLDSVF